MMLPTATVARTQDEPGKLGRLLVHEPEELMDLGSVEPNANEESAAVGKGRLQELVRVPLAPVPKHVDE